MKILIQLCTALLIIITPQQTWATSDTKLVVLVRHAEKQVDGGQDPSLTAQGYRRAEALALALKKTSIDLLIASQYQRTQQTLQAIAKERNLTIVTIDAANPIANHIQAIVDTVHKSSGNVLIAGHSNTVPLIIKALGGPDVSPIAEDDYSNLYMVSLNSTEKASLIATHYGQE